jgi:hypothetical protein
MKVVARAFDNGHRRIEKQWREMLQDYAIQIAKHAQQRRTMTMC